MVVVKGEGFWNYRVCGGFFGFSFATVSGFAVVLGFAVVVVKG